MGTTSISSGSGLAPKQWSDALFAMVGKQPTPMNSLSGPAPTIDRASKVLRRQSTTDMPVIRVRDLAQSAGDTVRVDCANIVPLFPVMGDENAEGLGSALDFSYADVKLDMATLPVSAGGKMTQKRMQHDLRQVAVAQLKGGIPSFMWQRALVQMAGARGQQTATEWIVPPDTHPKFASIMVNPVKAPTFNRHYVVNGANLTQGGAQLGSTLSTDALKLGHIDQLSAIVSEATIRLMPLRIPGDQAAGDDPIKGLLLLDHLVWTTLLTDSTTSNNIRQWQAAAMERAKYGGVAMHPLFSAGAFLWNNVLVRRMGDFGVRFLGGTAVNHVTQANRYTATETQVTLPALSGFQVNRSLLLGAQALAAVEGANTETGSPYSLLENRTNYKRNLEMAGELMASDWKIRFDLPDGNGNYEPTDIGAIAIDSVTARLSA